MNINRPLLDSELIISTELNLKRLIRGINEMDNHIPEAVLDVSSALRQLIAHGKGNRLLQRLVESGIANPIRFGKVSKVIEKVNTYNLRFQIAYIPMENITINNQNGPDLDSFLKTECLHIVSPQLKEEVIYNWDDLISVIANKLYGVHTDAERRKILDDLACYLVSGVPALRYALRTVGSAICTMGFLQLNSLGKKIESSLPPLFKKGTTELYNALVYGGINDENLDVIAQINFQSGANQEILQWIENGDPEWLFRPPKNLELNVKQKSIIKAGRNDPCPCGSGNKYKRCCGK